MKPHKWHKEIKAWADGAEIECNLRSPMTQKWDGWFLDSEPNWCSNENYKFRIKPQPKEPDFDATKYQKALKESGKKFKEKIEQAFAEILHKEVSKLAQPKEPQYLYVYADGNGITFSGNDFASYEGRLQIGKIKLENDDGA